MWGLGEEHRAWSGQLGPPFRRRLEESGFKIKDLSSSSGAFQACRVSLQNTEHFAEEQHEQDFHNEHIQVEESF